MGKVLVAYFSRGDENYGVGTIEVGNTEIIAKYIAEKLGADTFKIEPEKPYPADYGGCVEVATMELNEEMRPTFKGDVDLSEYDTVFLGYPIWWGDLPMICYTFLEKFDFSGKKVMPFNTHEGSGNSGTYQNIKEVLSNAEVIGDGFNMTGIVSRTEEGKKMVDDWLSRIGF